MHPLALEDVLHQRGHARSKADYYAQHLFLRVLCHTLSSERTEDASSFLSALRNSSGSAPPPYSDSILPDAPRSASPRPLDDKLGIALEDDEDLEWDETTAEAFADAEAGPVVRRTLLVRNPRLCICVT